MFKRKILAGVILLALMLQLAMPVMAEETAIPETAETGAEQEYCENSDVSSETETVSAAAEDELFKIIDESSEEEPFRIDAASEGESGTEGNTGEEGSGTEGGENPEEPLITPETKTEIYSVTLKYASKLYTGKARKQTTSTVVTAIVDGEEIPLTLGTDYKITYKNNVNVGTASLIVTGIGDYTGRIVKKFKIAPVKLKSVSVKYKYKVYTGTARTMGGATTVKAKVDGVIKTLKGGTDYTITYKNNVNVGTATMVVKGKGNYTGTITKTFKIYPKITTEKTRFWQRNNYKWYLKITAEGASAIWTKKTGQDWGLQVDSVGSLGYDSLGNYYYYDNGTMIAVNIMTGKEKWRYSNSTDLAGGASACFDASGNIYVVSGLAGNPIAKISKDGKLVKRYTWRKNNNYMWPKKIQYSNGKLILNAYNSSAIAVKLQINLSTGKVTQIG